MPVAAPAPCHLRAEADLKVIPCRPPQKLLHAHVVRFKEVFAAPPYLCIAMEYVSGGRQRLLLAAFKSAYCIDQHACSQPYLCVAMEYVSGGPAHGCR